jgi:hypothetical protein
MEGPALAASAGDDGATMKDLQTRVAEPQTRPRTAKDGPLAAEVARELLTQREWGVTRIAYVGLPEREAVQLVIDAHCDGLQAQTARGGAGRVSVTLTAPSGAPTGEGVETAPTDAAEAPATCPAALDRWQRAWTRLWAGGQHVTCLLGRRTP